MSNAALKLSIEGIGHVPSFKNSKMIARGRLITDPKKRLWMDKATAALKSQLKSLSATKGGVISTGQHRHCLTASLPQDDSWQWIAELNVKAIKVAKGKEGAVITIELL